MNNLCGEIDFEAARPGAYRGFGPKGSQCHVYECWLGDGIVTVRYTEMEHACNNCGGTARETVPMEEFHGRS